MIVAGPAHTRSSNHDLVNIGRVYLDFEGEFVGGLAQLGYDGRRR